MRILELEVEAFGPFRDRQVVDFAAAAHAGLLLIAGRTGAGKSSLLDAISFALYGSVPRYDGQVGRVRSDHAAPGQPTRVRLDFEMGGTRYRVERQPEWQRPKQRGAGTTLQKPEARLWAWNEAAGDDGSGDWEGLAARPADVGPELHRILGLSHEQFLQVVLLAQGGFQRFLHAYDQERQTTLRTLFRTERFADVERALVERRGALGERVGQAQARVTAFLEQAEAGAAEAGAAEAENVSPAAPSGTAPSGTVPSGTSARREAVAASVERDRAAAAQLRADAREAAGLAERADVIARESRRVAEAQRRLREARARAAELEGRRQAVDEDRARLRAAERAERALDRVRRAEQWAERSASAGTTHAEHRERLAAALAVAGRESGTAASELRDDVSGTLALLESAQQDEAGLPGLERECTGLEERIETLRRDHERSEQRAGALPGLVSAAHESRDEAGRLAASRGELERVRERTSRVREAARRLPQLEEQLVSAQKESAKLSGAAATAAAAVRDLLTRRLGGMAGELAAELEAGEPCSVCGSREHPAPAPHDDPVEPEAIAHAEQESARAHAALERARNAERDAEHALVETRTIADGATLAEAEERAAEAETALAAASRAESDLDGLRTRASELEAELSGAAEHTRRLAQEIADAERELVQARERRDRRAEAVREARGGFESIAARISAERGLRSAIDAVHESEAELRSAEAAAREAASERDAILRDLGFADADAVRASAMPSGERQALESGVAEFDAARERNAGVLADPAMRDLPDEPVPLEAHEAALAEARDSAQRAETAAATAEQRVRARAAALDRLDEAIAEGSEGEAELLRLRRLADTVQGKEPNTRRMRLEVFVLAARLEAIVAAANRRLQRMVGGRYTLEHDDDVRSRGRQSGLGLRVMDEYTGRARSAASLSGGETFLASLSLALGLADVVTAESGGITLDTLFVDEGFGSLDPDALDQAMATLDGLREGGRTVALISHVTEMQERIPAKLEVVVDGRGISRIRGDGVDRTGAAGDNERPPVRSTAST